MESFLKYLPVSTLFMFLPMILIKIGNSLKNRDLNMSGPDDAAGGLLIALAPAVAALDDNNETAFKKALRTTRDAINNYLGESK